MTGKLRKGETLWFPGHEEIQGGGRHSDSQDRMVKVASKDGWKTTDMGDIVIPRARDKTKHPRTAAKIEGWKTLLFPGKETKIRSEDGGKTT